MTLEPNFSHTEAPFIDEDAKSVTVSPPPSAHQLFPDPEPIEPHDPVPHFIIQSRRRLTEIFESELAFHIFCASLSLLIIAGYYTFSPARWLIFLAHLVYSAYKLLSRTLELLLIAIGLEPVEDFQWTWQEICSQVILWGLRLSQICLVVGTLHMMLTY